MPAFVVRVNRHARIPLRTQENAIAVLRGLGEAFITPAAPDHFRLRYRHRPAHRKAGALAGLQRRRQVQPHHGIHHGKRQWLACRIRNGQLIEAALPLLHALGTLNRVWVHFLAGHRPTQRGYRVAPVDVLVQLQPQVTQAVGRVVAITHACAAGQDFGVFVQ